MLWSKGVDLAVEAVRLARAEGARVELTIHGAPDPSNPKAIPEATLKRMGGPAGHQLGRADTRHRGRLAPASSLHPALARRRGFAAHDPGGGGLRPRDPDHGCAGLPQLRPRRAGRHRVVPADDAAALARALMLFASAPRRWPSAWATSARARLLDGYTERDVMNAVKALYRGLLASRRRGRGVSENAIALDRRGFILAQTRLLPVPHAPEIALVRRRGGDGALAEDRG
jgi:hypothetical protein